MTSTALEEFGYAIKKSRLDLGWNLEQLAADVLGNGARKGYVGQIEKGKRSLSPETIDKFDQALELPADIVKAVHMSPKLEVSEPEDDALDSDVERMIARADDDPSIPKMGETLLIALAYEFAGGKHLDLQTAHVGLRKALEAAERIRKRGEMPADNTGSQLNAVMAEVAGLNADGALDEANDLLDAEEKRMREEHKADKERQDEQSRRLLEQRLDQDRLRNDPTAAADRLVRDLMRQAPAGGVFDATSELLNEWQKRGESQGDPFDLNVALMLANRNMKRAKGFQKGFALHDLGNSRRIIGERSVDLTFLHSAEKALRAVQKASRIQLASATCWLCPRNS